MTSHDHKIGQILKLIYLRQYWSYSIDQKLKMSEMLMAIFLVYSTSGITSGKKSLSGSKWRPFWNFWNIKHNFNLTSDMNRSSQIMPKIFLWWLKILRFLLKTHCRRRGWWYHVPHSSYVLCLLGSICEGQHINIQLTLYLPSQTALLYPSHEQTDSPSSYNPQGCYNIDRSLSSHSKYWKI